MHSSLFHGVDVADAAAFFGACFSISRGVLPALNLHKRAHDALHVGKIIKPVAPSEIRPQNDHPNHGLGGRDSIIVIYMGPFW